jgi:hypothetical protein
MMIHNRCQRKIKENIVGRKISEKEFDYISGFDPRKNRLFVLISNATTVLSEFYMSQATMGKRIEAHISSVKNYLNDFVEQGLIIKIYRGVKKTCIYKTTPWLKMVIAALLPLMPDLYTLNKFSFSQYLKELQFVPLSTIVNNDLSVPTDKDKSLYLYYYSKREDSVRRREAVLSLLAMGPQSSNSSNVTWVRGNAPEWDTSIVEKEREMADENYEEYKELFPDWRKPASHGPSTRHPLQNHGRKRNEAHQRGRAPQTIAKQQPGSNTVRANYSNNTNIREKENVQIIESSNQFKDEKDPRHLPTEQDKFYENCLRMKKEDPLWKWKVESGWIKLGVKSMWPDSQHGNPTGYNEEYRAEIMDYVVNRL